MAFRYGNFLTTGLAAGHTIAEDATSIEIDSNKRVQFNDLVEATGDEAILVIKEEVGGETHFEIVKATGMSGNNLEVVRAQEGTTAREFTSAAQITSTVTAERAAIIGGTANIDIMPDIDDSKKLGERGKVFSEIHAKELAVKADNQEFVIKKPTVVSATGNTIDLLLPKDTGTLARLEDSVEAHPGCFSGSLCVEPAAEEVENAVARGHSDIGDGIHIIAHYDDEGQRRLKLAKYVGDGGTLVAELGLGLVPGTGGGTEEPARYRRQMITVGGDTYNYLNVEAKTIGDYETVDGEIPVGFTQDLVGQWLENLTFTRQPPGTFVANSIYGQDISADNIVSEDVEAVDSEFTSSAKFSGNLRIPVVTESPGHEQDTTEGYEAGSVVYATATSTTYICVDATEDEAIWRPMSPVPEDHLTLLTFQTQREYGSGGDNNRGSGGRPRMVIGEGGLSQYKRFYIDYDCDLTGNWEYGNPRYPRKPGNLSQVVSYIEFKEGKRLYAAHGTIEARYVSEDTLEVEFHSTITTNPGAQVSVWGEA